MVELAIQIIRISRAADDHRPIDRRFLADDEIRARLAGRDQRRRQGQRWQSDFHSFHVIYI